MRRSINRRLLPLPWCLIFLVSVFFISHKAFDVSALTTIYDFIAHAPEASWISGAGTLTFPGDPADGRGFARYADGATLEDGSTWQRVLETHPQWVGGGWIMGSYPQQTVPSNVQLTVRIGFLSGATGTDGARFEVYFDEYRGLNVAPLRYTILSKVATLDGALDAITCDLDSIAGRKGTFILYVNAGQSSGRDWAVWAEARIESKAMPDLVITDIWEEDGQIHYKVKNVGDVATSAESFCNSLSVDGVQAAKNYINQALQAGQEVEGAFDYGWKPAPGEHSMRVCADCEQVVDEANEQNNCLEENWVKEDLPDLVIFEIKSDRNNSIVGYVLKNVGVETAKGGHLTTLYVDGEETTHNLVGVDLDPGETYESWFTEYEWPECHNITVRVCADNYDQVKESDEGNNYLERVCISYPISISITYGPNANATQDSVTIVWVTNKKSDSSVVYTDRMTGKENTVYDQSLVKGHQISIEDLMPKTTYRFYVASKDLCGNFATSKSRTFETESPPDEESPSVTLFLPEDLSGVVDVTANAADNVGVTEVIFLMDAHVKFIDFSPPYLWVCNTTLFPNGAHSFRAVAFDAAMNSGFDARNGTINNIARDIRSPAVSVLRPQEGESVIGMVEIEALTQDMALAGEPIGHIQKFEIYVDSVLVKSWVYSPFRFDILRREFVTEAPTNRLALTHLWNTTGLELGSEHEIEARGWDDSGNYGHASINVSITQFEEYQPPLELRIIDLEVTRDVVRHDIYQTTYLVTLNVRNTGTETLSNFTLRDDVCGYQVIPDTASMSVTFVPSFWTSTVMFKPDPRAALSPGGVATIQYYAVPILFNPPIPDDCYIFGWLPTSVSFACDGVSYGRSFELAHSPGREDTSLVLGSSDYLIVTNPSRLFANYPGDEAGANSLLVKMAELARIKLGVLGYLEGSPCAEDLKALISPRGIWASRLCPAFTDPNPDEDRDAYLLIVGETEIVPSYTYDEDEVILSDHYYADVIRGGAPDIIVGRIIGDNAGDLMKPIVASIDVALGHGFNRGGPRLAVAASGEENGIPFVDNAETIVGDLASQGISGETVHWSDFVMHTWRVPFTNYDAFALGDIDEDGIDEVIIANDEEARIYIYEPLDGHRVGSFPCRFTRYDGFTTGDVDGDRVDEIVIAVAEEDLAYVYEPDGTLRGSWHVEFDNWDQIATGEILDEYGESNYGWPKRDEIIIADHDDDYVDVYMLTHQEESLSRKESLSLDLDFTSYDGFAVGNVRGDWGGDEIVIIRDDDEKIYVYKLTSAYTDITGKEVFELRQLNRDRSFTVRFTHYDGFALGDVDGNGRDEMIVVCDEDERIFRYYWNGTDWCGTSMYSGFLSDWFYGIRYTGSPTRHDGFAIGNVLIGEDPKIVLIKNRDGDTSRFYVLASTSDDAGIFANERLGAFTDAMSIFALRGHGSPSGAHPTGVEYEDYWGDLSMHPFVLSLSCDTGDYESRGYSFGEALFKHGAGVFIGATRASNTGLNQETARSYFKRWDIWGESAGKAFILYERRRYRDGWVFWVKEYNYYGDPKLP